MRDRNRGRLRRPARPLHGGSAPNPGAGETDSADAPAEGTQREEEDPAQSAGVPALVLAPITVPNAPPAPAGSSPDSTFEGFDASSDGTAPELVTGLEPAVESAAPVALETLPQPARADRTTVSESGDFENFLRHSRVKVELPGTAEIGSAALALPAARLAFAARVSDSSGIRARTELVASLSRPALIEHSGAVPPEALPTPPAETEVLLPSSPQGAPQQPGAAPPRAEQNNEGASNEGASGALKTEPPSRLGQTR